jgi:GntR family transcriptional repressor for pyruvate dehydrogenase complex
MSLTKRMIKESDPPKSGSNRSIYGSLRRVTHRVPLVEQVVERMRSQIVNGDYAADLELPPESALCEKLGVSRTVIREAMRILRAQGLVEVSQGKRPRIKPADAQFAIDGLSLLLRRSDTSLLHLTELRRPLESEIAALAAERATDEHLARMQQTLIDLRDAPDLEASVEADLLFHTILAEATANPVFHLVLLTIWGLLRTSRVKTIAYSKSSTALHWHERIFRAVSDHNPAKAREEMLGHIEAVRLDLAEAIPDGAAV